MSVDVILLEYESVKKNLGSLPKLTQKTDPNVIDRQALEAKRAIDSVLRAIFKEVDLKSFADELPTKDEMEDEEKRLIQLEYYEDKLELFFLKGILERSKITTAVSKAKDRVSKVIDRTFNRSARETSQQTGVPEKLHTDSNIINDLRMDVEGLISNLTYDTRREVEELMINARSGFISSEEFLSKVETIKNKSFARSKSIAVTETTRTSVDATEDRMRRSGFRFWRWSSARERIDAGVGRAARTCEFCDALHGRTVPIGKPFGYLKGEPIIKPPVHPNCFDKETEVLTDKGWKLFKDLNGEKIWSLNPETQIPEWVDYTQKVSYHYNGNLIHFKSQILDMMVTPNHKVYVGQRKYKIGNVWSLQEAKDVTHERFYAGCNWIGEDPKFIKMENEKIHTEDYCKLMGYYLSDGSISKVNGDSDKLMVQIAQMKEKSKLQMYEDLVKIFHTTRNKNGIVIYDFEIGKYLKQFGHAGDKYVPQEIKDLSPRLIRIFLDAFCLGDGHKRIVKGKLKSGNLITHERTHYYTSSDNLVRDLTELILKTGKSCSFKLNHKAGSQGNIKGRDFIRKRNVWAINESKYTTKKFGKNNITHVPYNDMVYCAELKKYHILLVRRNMKLVWSGNCRCGLVAVESPYSQDIRPRSDYKELQVTEAYPEGYENAVR